MKTLIQLTIATLLTLTALAEPKADYVVTIENHKVTVFDAKAVDIAVADLHQMPDNRNDMRSFTRAFMLEVAAHYHDDHAMFVIITDEYPSAFEYKAYVKRFTPEDVTAVIPPQERKP